MHASSAWLVDVIQGLPCRVLLPEPYRPDVERYPLILSLHGSGERGTDNVAQLKNGLTTFERPHRRRRAILVAPQLPRDETFGGSWYGGESVGQRTVISIANELKARRSVDENRVFSVGFSMGAIGLWDILVRQPGVFSAAVLIAGDLDVDRSTSLTSFPLWAVHGAKDELVPPHNTRAFAKLVGENGGSARYTEVLHAGHDVWRWAFDHDPLWEWLLSR